MAILTNHFVLGKNNKHLQDIFNEEYYLELGNINTNVLTRLLKHKLVRYSDLSYFDIQNKGIGTSNIDNTKLKEKIPYFYFENFAHKDIRKKLILTYGIIVQRKGYKELFTPIILLPVDIMIDNSDIWFKLCGAPIENPYLPYKTRQDALEKEMFKDGYDIDDYCMNIYRQDRPNLRMESYLTFVNTVLQNSNFSNEKFATGGPNYNLVESGFNLNKEDNICNITTLNRMQRICLEEANYGNSFAISGILGTGKTTTLANIASNAIHKNKKVLYISNNEETLDEITKIYNDKGLGSMLINLVDLEIKESEKYQFEIPNVNVDTFVRSELETKYDGVRDYTKAIYKKENGFRFLDIVKGMLEYKDASLSLDESVLEGIENIYRQEAEEIEEALGNLDNNLSKIDSFKNSKFNNIPIKNQSSVSEITSMIDGICNYYQALVEKKKELETNFGFSAIPNYAYFRNIINNYFLLDKNLVPQSWLEYDINDCKKKDLKNYTKARTMFEFFSKEINDANNKEETLKQEYNTSSIGEIDIHYAINLILSKFKNYSEDVIDKFLHDNANLIAEFKVIKQAMEDCEYNFGKMRDKIGIKVNYRDTESINQIVPFIQFFEKNRIPKAWLDIKNSQGIRTKIEGTIKQIKKYEELQSIYNTYFIDITNIDNNITFLEKKRKKAEKYKNISIDELINDLKTYKEMNVNIEDVYKQYYSLTLEENINDKVLEKFDEFSTLLHNINDERISTKLVKNLNTLKDGSLEEFIKPFIIFSTTYIEIINFYQELISYNLVKSASNLPDMMHNINLVSEYCDSILDIQNKMNKIIKGEFEFVPYKQYLILASKIENLVLIRTKIDNNNDYKYLYGNLFKGYSSSIDDIKIIIDNFDNYIKIFSNNDAIKESFNKDSAITLDDILHKAFDICENVNELIKDYSKTFRDGTGKYYYDNMDSIIEYDKTLLEDVAELKVYLRITRSMQVLLKYKLYNLNDYIINHDKELFKDRFMIAYYTYLYNKFVHENEIIQNGEGFYKLIDDILGLEDKIAKSNIDDLTLHNLPHTPNPSFRHTSLDKYIEHIHDNKSLYLTNTDILNNYLNVTMFDLVLVDDANLNESDEYTKVLACPQVIFAGINNIRVGIYNDVLTKIKNNAIIELKQRYIESPYDLVSHMERAECDFYSDVAKNKGIEVTKDSMVNIILSLITQDMQWDEYFRVKLNKDVRINCFVKSLNLTKKLFDEIASNLMKLNISLEDIYYVLRKQVNITDLHDGYLWNAHYNIIDLDDYNEENDIYENKNLISNLICPSKKLYIIDNSDLLNSDKELGFVKEIKCLLKEKNIIYPISDVSCLKLSQILARHKFKVLGQYQNYDIVVEKNGKNYGIIVFNSPSNFGNDILNVYRDKKLSNFYSLVIYINDLIKDYNGSIDKLIGEMKDE